MQILSSVLPIFLIIGLGIGARKWKLITAEFLKPANRLVYYISIPAFLFSAVVKGNPGDHFDVRTTALTLLCAAGLYLSAHFLSKVLALSDGAAGTFIQSCAHGNQGYIGLPVVFYYLGENSLGSAAIMCGLLMILQNISSVFFLQLHSNTASPTFISQAKTIGSKLKENPIIIAVSAGLAFSAAGIELPGVIESTLKILGGLAPPLALLLIGASLSLSLIRIHFRLSFVAALLKLFALPLLALLLFSLSSIDALHGYPALILLAAPTATVTYIMAGEMGGKQDLAVATVSLSTLLSCISYPIWLAAFEFLAGH